MPLPARGNPRRQRQALRWREAGIVLLAETEIVLERESPLHRHEDEWQVLALLDSSLVIRIEGSPWTLLAGDLAVVPPGHRHQIAALPGVVQCRFLDLRLAADGSSFDAWLRRHGDGPVRFAGGEAAAALRQALHGLPDGPQAAIAAAAWTLLAHWERAARSRPVEERTPSGDPRVQLAESIMREQLHLPLDVAAIAARVGLSRSQLHRLFATAHGRSPALHLRELRLAQAYDLVRGGTLPIAQVAATCGFPNPEHFSSLFRRRFGQPPGSVRRGSGKAHVQRPIQPPSTGITRPEQ